jgi:HSP20 family protein
MFHACRFRRGWIGSITGLSNGKESAMERERARTGEPVKRVEERGRWRDAAQRDTEERAGVEAAGARVEQAADREERDRMERERMERERAERERRDRELRERSERGDLMGRGMGGSSLAARDPWIASHFDFMRQFMREMSRMFEGWPGSMRTMGGTSGYTGASPYQGSTTYPSSYQGSSLSGWPPIEVEERDGRMVIRAELPGMDLQDVRVCLEGNYLLIEGDRREDRNREREGYYETEWSYGHFSRRIPMPPGVTPDQIHATCENGVLELTIDVPSRNVREIPIATERSGREGRVTGRASDRDRDVPPARAER